MIQGRDYASIDGNHVDLKADTSSFHIVRGSFQDRDGVCKADPTLAQRDAITAAGKRFGAYMILAWHGVTPEDQVDVFVKAYGARKPGELCVWLDLEADSAAALHMTPQACLDWAHRAYDALVKIYRVVGIYTSVRVWSDVFGNLPSRMGGAPLWLKVAYPYKVRSPHHPEAAPQTYTVPGPWMPASSPGAWVVQYQGDAIKVPGFSSTVDCNYFMTRKANAWVTASVGDVMTFQAVQQLDVDGVVGLNTFCAMLDVM